MENNPIQGFWDGGPLTTMEKLSICSFLANGHQFHLYSYHEVEGVPAGAELKDASLILPQSEMNRFKDVYAYGDWFRIWMLNSIGGWWSDLDNICLKPFDMPEEHVGMCNPLKCPPGSPVLAWVFDECKKLDFKKMHGEALGPQMWINALKQFPEYKLDKYMPFFHIPGDATHIVSARPPDVSRHYSVHIHHQSWRTNKQDVDGVFPYNCLYEVFKRRYLTGQEGIAFAIPTHDEPKIYLGPPPANKWKVRS